jgi:hypothetical protein
MAAEIKGEMVAKSEFDELKSELNSHKTDTKREIIELRAEMNAGFDKLYKLILSQQTKTELDGELVPSPAEGVVDENQIIMVDNVALFKRFKGRVLILRRVVVVCRKRWKYE